MIKWKTKLHGFCPIQAEGYFMGHYFYFRARHSKATIEFSKSEEDWIKYDCKYKYTLLTVIDPQAGWLPKWVCRLLIWKGCIKFMFKKK
jgi:hypothetical protein